MQSTGTLVVERNADLVGRTSHHCTHLIELVHCHLHATFDFHQRPLVLGRLRPGRLWIVVRRRHDGGMCEISLVPVDLLDTESAGIVVFLKPIRTVRQGSLNCLSCDIDGCCFCFSYCLIHTPVQYATELFFWRLPFHVTQYSIYSTVRSRNDSVRASFQSLVIGHLHFPRDDLYRYQKVYIVQYTLFVTTRKTSRLALRMVHSSPQQTNPVIVHVLALKSNISRVQTKGSNKER
jgi:hypothetical protein